MAGSAEDGAEPAPRVGRAPRRTAHEDVRDSLRQAILNGTLAAGSPLVLTDLSAALGVSKTPIREAIRDLAGEGLVDFDSYKSSLVHTPTVTETREIYAMRLALEPLEVRKSVGRIGAADLKEAAALQRQMEGVAEVGAWIALNRDFHNRLTDRGAAPLLNETIVALRNKSALQVAWSLSADPRLMGRANADHAAILDAYQSQDGDAAVASTEHHLRATLEAIEGQRGG